MYTLNPTTLPVPAGTLITSRDITVHCAGARIVIPAGTPCRRSAGLHANQYDDDGNPRPDVWVTPDDAQFDGMPEQWPTVWAYAGACVWAHDVEPAQ